MFSLFCLTGIFALFLCILQITPPLAAILPFAATGVFFLSERRRFSQPKRKWIAGLFVIAFILLEVFSFGNFNLQEFAKHIIHFVLFLASLRILFHDHHSAPLQVSFCYLTALFVAGLVSDFAFYAAFLLPILLTLAFYLNEARHPGLKKASFRSALLLICLSIPLSAVIFLILPRTHQAVTPSTFQPMIQPLDVQGKVPQSRALLFTAKLPMKPGGYYWRMEVQNIFDGHEWESAIPESNRLLENIKQESDEFPIFLTNNWTFQQIPTLSETASVRVADGHQQLQSDDAGIWYRTETTPKNYLISVGTGNWKYNEIDSHIWPYGLTEHSNISKLAHEISHKIDSEEEIAFHVMRYLQTNYRYTQKLPRRSEWPVSDFLFEQKEGHCAFFSTAMVVLLQSLNLNARNVTGFYSNEYHNDRYFVRASDAHSWVELWVPGKGWVSYDPTPHGSPLPALATDIRKISDRFESYSFEKLKSRISGISLFFWAPCLVGFGLLVMTVLVWREKRQQQDGRAWLIGVVCMLAAQSGAILLTLSSPVLLSAVVAESVVLSAFCGIMYFRRISRPEFIFHSLKSRLYEKKPDIFHSNLTLEALIRLATEEGFSKTGGCLETYMAFRFGADDVPVSRLRQQYRLAVRELRGGSHPEKFS